MSDARLYEDFIMEHIKNARNYRVLDDADRTASATQPMSAGRLAMLETIKRFPARARCAALPWMTLQGALDCLQDTAVVPAT